MPNLDKENKKRKKKINKIENKDIKIEKVETEKEEEIKKFMVRINKVEDNAIIATIGGYSKRIYFDLSFRDLEYLRDHRRAYINKMLTIYYIGDIFDAFKVKILPIKSLEHIGSR